MADTELRWGSRWYVRRLLFPILGAVLSFALLEGGLLAVTWVSPRAAAVLDEHAGLLVPDDELIHRPSPHYPEHDAWGFRNEVVPNRADVVVLGDSQTYGAMVRSNEAWPQQLAAISGRTVYNMAFGGYGPGEALVLLEDALTLRPGVVLFGLYTGNDLFDCFEFVYETDTFSELRSPDARLLESIADFESQGGIEEAFDRQYTPGSTVKQWLGAHSKVYGLARALRNAARGSAWQYEETNWESIRNAAATHPYQVVIDNSNARTILTPRYRLLALDQEDPRIQEGARLALEFIAAMRARVEAAGAEFVVVALPTKELVFEDLARAEPFAVSPSLDKMWRDEKSFWDSLRAFCAANQIPIVETLEVLQSSLAEGARPFRQDTDGHLTVSGNRVVAETVREAIDSLTTDH